MKNPMNEKYLSDAEEVFFGADGGAEDFFAVNEDGGTQVGEKQMQYSYANGAGDAVAVQQPDFQSIFTIQVENGNAFDVDVTLFNAQKNLVSPTFGLPPLVTLTVLESDYPTVLSSTMFAPLKIRGMRFESNPAKANYTSQLRQVLRVDKNDLYGVQGLYRIQANSYIQLSQQIDYAVDIAPYSIEITGQTGLTFKLLSEQTATFTFFAGMQVHTAHALHNRPAMGVVASPLPIMRAQPLVLTQTSTNALAQAIKS